MTLDNLDTDGSAPSEKVGYMNPPKKHQFKAGCPSANPSGRPRKDKADLLKKFETKLYEDVPASDKKRGKISRLRLLLRNLVEKASNGDGKALAEVIRMLKARDGETAPTAPDWHVTRYSSALAARPRSTFTEEFYCEQDKKIAQWMKELKAGNGSIKAMLEKELSRKVEVTVNGKARKVPVSEVIVARFFRAAADDPASLRQLLSLVPEKKHKRDYSRIEVLRPTKEEIAWCGSPDDPEEDELPESEH